MLSVEAFSGVIFVAIFIMVIVTLLLMWGVTACNSRYQKSRCSKCYTVLLVIFYLLSALSITAIAVVYLIGVEPYITDAKHERDLELSTNVNCTVTEVYAGINAYDNKFYYIVWLSYNNITQSYYGYTCNNVAKCWPAVNDSMSCWPVTNGSVITHYTLDPSLTDVEFYEGHKKWAITQLVFSIIGTIVFVVSIICILCCE